MNRFLVFIYLFVMIFGGHSWTHADISKRPFFTVKQEEFLALNMPVFAYFSELYVDKKTPDQIAKDYNLSEPTNLKYLKALEDIGVIEKVSTDKLTSPVHFLVSGVFSFSKYSPLSSKATEFMLKDYYEKFLGLAGEKNTKFYLASPGFWLTEEEFKQSKKDLEALEEKYIELSLKNRKEKNKKAFRVSAIIGLISKWEPTIFHKVE